LIILTHGHEGNLLYLFFVGFFGGTTLELTTGLIMNRIFHMRWWDYSQNPLNFHGYICLPASVGWGIAAVFVTRAVHPYVADIPAKWSYIHFIVVDTMFYTLFVEDIVFSVIGALELRERVARLAKNSEEIQSLRKSIAEVYDRLATARADFGQSAGELLEVQKTEGNVAAAKFMANSIKDSTVAVASSVRNSVQNVAGDVKDSAGAMLGRFWKNENLQDLEKSREQMEAQLSILEDGGNAQSGKMPWWVKTMLRNNPEAVSEERGFDDLKKAAMKPLKEKKERTSL
jgi:putative membrane protein